MYGERERERERDRERGTFCMANSHTEAKIPPTTLVSNYVLVSKDLDVWTPLHLKHLIYVILKFMYFQVRIPPFTLNDNI